jgi:serine phosphatase RsbU (regulator of sigma subunit)
MGGMPATGDIVRSHPVPLALLLLAALMVVDAGSGTQIAGAFCGAALVASMLTSARDTALVGMAATAAALASGTWHDTLGTRDWAVRAVLCALLSALCVVSAASRSRRERRLQRMNVIADAAQRAVLRCLPSAVGSVAIAARYESAYEDAAVGGDFYELSETPHGVRFVIGDVRGKGLEAVQLAASVLGGFRSAAFSTVDLVDVALRLDVVVAAVAGDEDFVTAVLAEFHTDGSVTVVNCGHHPPLLVPPSLSSGTLRPLSAGHRRAGPAARAWAAAPQMVRHCWSPGSRLLFYTDGLVEARDRFGPSSTRPRTARSWSDPPSTHALDALVDRLLAHTGRRLDDDMALVLTQRL